jgi:SAM-dependent methyltransferase
MYLKSRIKRYGFIAISIRAIRETVRSWQRVAENFREERETQLRLEQRQRIVDTYVREHGVRKLQVGSGDNPLPGWLNTDLDPALPAVIYLDALEPFPFDDQLFDYVFSEHMIEHVSYLGGLGMLHECFRILKPGGSLRIATPNIEQIAGLCTLALRAEQKAYVGWSMDHLGLYAPQESRFQKRRPEWAIDPRHLEKFFPRRDEDPVCFVVNNFFQSYGHQFLYNPSTLRAALDVAGFEDVRQCEPGESDDVALRGVETHHQQIGDAMNGFETMVFEAMRPA